MSPEPKGVIDASGKKEEKTNRPPKRAHTVSVEESATDFIAAVLAHYNSKKQAFTSKKFIEVPILFRNWCSHKGFRGKQKAAVWANVKRQLAEAKAAAQSPDAEL